MMRYFVDIQLSVVKRHAEQVARPRLISGWSVSKSNRSREGSCRNGNCKRASLMTVQVDRYSLCGGDHGDQQRTVACASPVQPEFAQHGIPVLARDQSRRVKIAT